MPVGNPNTGQTGPASVAALFAANGWESWWANTGIQHFNARPGSNNCTDPGASEYGNDYLPSYKATIRSITNGTVIYSQLPPEYSTFDNNGGGHTSIGYVIQIRNGDGSIIHFQHMLSTPLKVGVTVNVGDIVGVAGGCPQGCYGQNACTCQDAWSTGAHIEVRYSAKEVNGVAPWCNGNWQDPVPIIDAITGSAPVGSSASATAGLSAHLGNLPGLIAHIPNPFQANSDVAQVFYAIDETMNIIPFLPPYQTVSLFGVSIPDPAMAYELVFNLMQDFGALFWRFLIAAMGVYICFKVFNNVVNVTGKFGGVLKGGAELAGGAVALGAI